MNDTFPIVISKLKKEHTSGVLKLYKRVAALSGGIARQAHEVTEGYVSQIIKHAIDRGMGLVVVLDSRIVGEVHAYVPEPDCFSHVMSDLTIAVDTHCQGQGVGRLLFEKLLQEIQMNMPHVLRVELIVRESNHKAIAFYQSLGFEKEGQLNTRIKNTDGSYEADIPMAWLRA